MGAIGGLLGAGFHHALHFVTHVRSEHMWLIFLLPLGGLVTVANRRAPMSPALPGALSAPLCKTASSR